MRASKSEETRTESTKDLTAAVSRGDPAALSRFYEAWFDRAFAMARALTRKDEAFCLDVVQDCMLRVARKMTPLRDEPALSSWMARAVTRTAIDRMRQEERRTRRERAAALPEAGSNREDALPLGDDERVAWIRAQLAELPVLDRTLLAERFSGEKTLDAVGATLGISGDAAHGRIWRLLSRLRRAAAERFHD